MITKIRICVLFMLFTQMSCGQKVENPAFDAMLQLLIDWDVPTVSVAELKAMQKKEPIILLDAREPVEYAVSHLRGAKNVGYTHFSLEKVKKFNKNAPIVVYCSVGYRSAKVVKKLQDAGYSQVFNLYGSLFEWVNQGNEVVDSKGKPTLKVHTYDKNWAKWLDKGEKVY